MRRANRILALMLAVIVGFSFAVLPVSAAKLKGEKFNLINESTGYKMIIPGFIEQAEVEVQEEDNSITRVNVTVVEAPAKNSNGTYPIFEVIAPDSKAAILESFPVDYGYGTFDHVETKFSNSSTLYSSPYFNKNGFEHVSEDDIYIFDFIVMDKYNEVIFEVYDLNFMFVQPVKKKTATPISSTVVIDGQQVELDAYTIDNNNYFKLRDFAAAITGTDKQFEVSWDSVNHAIKLFSGKAYTRIGDELLTSVKTTVKQAAPTKSAIYLDDEEIDLTAYNIDDNNYFKLRDIAKAFDISVVWEPSSRTIVIDTKQGYTME